ncbi:putative te1b-like protein [Erysiphe necator]|uniref:Putative te1b-like protein n=1 Tax=Uncinula necator TaxID=52586 RepID=A0A0B1P4K4_UNCNE|nr:putative te1b-like protein [Erysiphe necator]
MSCVQRACRQLPQADIAHSLIALAYSKRLGIKTLEVNRFKLWLRQISSFEICAFSDGSTTRQSQYSFKYVCSPSWLIFK